jgi:hypothetical protein
MYSEIIPNHLQQELIQIGEDITKHTFRVGDIVITITEYVRANQMPYTKSQILRAVGAFIGKAASTVRGYEAISLYYPMSVRKQYEVLSSSHFRKAIEIDRATDYTWKDVLDYAVKRVDEYGRPATVEEIVKVFIYNAEPYECEEEEPLEATVYNPLEKFESALESLKKAVDLLPVPEVVREEIRSALTELEAKFSALFRIEV